MNRSRLSGPRVEPQQISMDHSRRIWAVALVVAVIFTVLGTPRTAWAHNALVGTAPAAGTTVAEPPATVVLTFNEPAISTGTKVLVTGPDGSATQGDPRLVDNTVRQDLQAALPAGEYTVEWRVTSADGHPVNGTFSFRARAGARIDANVTPTPSLTPVPSPTAPTGSASVPATSAATPAANAGDGTRGDAGTAGWLWLLAIIPVGLAVALGWRFSRRRS